jgi:hypothetical protein
MTITNELRIRGEPPQLERLLARVEALLHDGWKRDRQAEERGSRHGTRGPWDYCFSCTAKAGRPAAGFWVHAGGSNELYVAHVLPLEKQRLSEDESYRVLAEFEQEFLGPAAAEVGAETSLVQNRHTLEHELSREAARLLRAFSESANRKGLDPNDRQRWNAFLVRVHQDDALFDTALLDEWLREEDWPEDTRRQLLGEYEAARSLLLAYDEEAARR